MRPSEGYLVIGRSENHNHGPISMTCLDLSSGEVVYDIPCSAKKEFRYGTETDAATIAILYAIHYARKRGEKPIIYTANRNAKMRISKISGEEQELFGESIYGAAWNPIIEKGVETVKTFDDVEIRIWNKDVYGENPLKNKYFRAGSR